MGVYNLRRNEYRLLFSNSNDIRRTVMGKILVPVPYFTGDIVMDEIEEATHREYFTLEGKPIDTVIRYRPASLERYEGEPGKYLLEVEGGGFVVFYNYDS